MFERRGVETSFENTQTQGQQEAEVSSSVPVNSNNLHQFNQHIMLGVQAVSRLRTVLEVRSA